MSALRIFVRVCLAVAALSGLGLTGLWPAAADELVKFDAAAKPADSARGPALQGYLTRPNGRGPFPAVVLLHSCLGLPAARRSIGEALARWGYVALFVDDFSTRRIKETCAVDFPEGVSDAFGALGFPRQAAFRRPQADRRRRLLARRRHGAANRLVPLRRRLRSPGRRANSRPRRPSTPLAPTWGTPA